MMWIKFCRDGILRKSFMEIAPDAGGEDVRHLVPLLAWEKSVDPHIFLKCLNHPIGFEDGLTVGELFENLAPWADVMTGVACMDFPAFLAEVRRGPSEPFESVEKILIQYRATIAPVPRFEKRKRVPRKDADGLSIFGIGRPMRSGKLYLEEGWDYSALLKEEARAEYHGSKSISLSFVPLSEWAHLPIDVDREAMLYDETANHHNSVYLGTRMALTRKDHQNVEARLSGGGQPLAHEIRMSIPRPSFYDTIVRGFLWEVGFDYSPVQRDERADEVYERISEVKEMIGDGADAASRSGERAGPVTAKATPMDAIDERRKLEYLDELRRLASAEAYCAEHGLTITPNPRARAEED